MAESKKDKLFYAYPCDEPCIEFLESGSSKSFAEFSETVCGSGCPNCIWLDIPYTEEMKRIDG